MAQNFFPLLADLGCNNERVSLGVTIKCQDSLPSAYGLFELDDKQPRNQESQSGGLDEVIQIRQTASLVSTEHGSGSERSTNRILMRKPTGCGDRGTAQ